MEHPNTLPWIERQWGDTDSGPVVLGVGTSACAFMIPAAIANGDKEMALSTLQLAQYMADYKWIGEKYVATNVFHEVGQAIIFYGICFILFRYFDIMKPFPVSFFDKNFKNSFGVIMDDVCAGFYVVLSLICFMILKSYIL